MTQNWKLMAFAVSTAIAFVSTPALGRRTTVDGNGLLVTQGYCDFNGQDCTPQQLGFSIDFGNGPITSFIIYGNGLISFGDTPVDYAQSANYGRGSDLSLFGGSVIAPGLFNTIVPDFYGSNQNVFATSAYVISNTGSRLQIGFQYCDNVEGTNTCRNQADTIITPTSSGLSVDIFHSGAPRENYYGTITPGSGFFNFSSLGTVAAGYSIDGSAVMFDTPF